MAERWRGKNDVKKRVGVCVCVVGGGETHTVDEEKMCMQPAAL